MKHHFHQPALIEYLGGLGCQTGYVHRANTFLEFGFMPETVRNLFFDFTSDPPAPPSREFPHIPGSVWAQAAPCTEEFALVSLGDDARRRFLVERLEARAPEVQWMKDIVPAKMLANYGGAEACRTPAFMRLALALCAHQPLDRNGLAWPAAIERALMDLAPAGAARQQLGARPGISSEEIDQDGPVRVLLVAGAEGGTGNGGLIPAAIATRWLAGRKGIPVQLEALLVTSHYRPRDGQESGKAAVAHALDLDMDYVMNPAARLSFPLGPKVTATASGPLFTRIYRQEAGPQFEHNTSAVIDRAACTLRYLTATREGFEMLKRSVNGGTEPALRRLAAENYWPERKH